MNSEETAEDELLGYLHRLSIDSLSPAAVEACEALILDHFTCALVGMRLPWTRIVRDTARNSHAGPAAMGHAFVYGEVDPVSPMTAALVNGTAAHAFDLDDLYFPAMSHPGCIINAAAFAAAGPSVADGRDLIAAVAAGYELMARVGAAVGVRNGNLGFHATGQQGPMAAALAASRVRLMSRQETIDAVGIAASFGGGIKAFTSGRGMIKRLHAGRAAQSGLFAAELARGGFEGPARALSGRYGFLNVFAIDGSPAFAALTSGLGTRFGVEDIYIKPFAACGALHGALIAAEMTRERVRFDPSDIDRVVVGSSQRVMEQNDFAEPTDLMLAQYSMQYCVALALLGRARNAGRFFDFGTARDADVREVARVVTIHVDDRAQAVYPKAMGGSVTVHLRDGRVVEAYGECDEASSRGWEVARTKFWDTTSDHLEETDRENVLSAVRALRHGGPAHGCVSALRGGAK